MANDYYDVGGISTIDIIRAKLTEEQYKGFLLGNIIKYNSRLNWKGEPQKDSEKLSMYSMWLQELLEDPGETPMRVDAPNADSKNPCDTCDHKHQAATLPPCKDCLYSEWKPQHREPFSLIDVFPCLTCKYSDSPIYEEPCCACGTANNFARYKPTKNDDDSEEYKHIDPVCLGCKHLATPTYKDPCYTCIYSEGLPGYEPKERDE